MDWIRERVSRFRAVGCHFVDTLFAHLLPKVGLMTGFLIGVAVETGAQTI
jgi:hypothetical protein